MSTNAPLNRQQRRQKARQLKQERREMSNAGKDRARIKRILSAQLNQGRMTGLELLNNCAPWSEGEILEARIWALSDFESIRAGCGKTAEMADAFNRTAFRLTIGRIRAREIDATNQSDSGAEDLFKNAQAAFSRIADRFNKTQIIAFDAAGFTATQDALNLYLDIFAASTSQQMRLAASKIMHDARKNPNTDYLFPLIYFCNKNGG